MNSLIWGEVGGGDDWSFNRVKNIWGNSPGGEFSVGEFSGGEFDEGEFGGGIFRTPVIIYLGCKYFMFCRYLVNETLQIY